MNEEQKKKKKPIAFNFSQVSSDSMTESSSVATMASNRAFSPGISSQKSRASLMLSFQANRTPRLPILFARVRE
jgi:hypothetical protein